MEMRMDTETQQRTDRLFTARRYIFDEGDCDDTNSNSYPNALEVCDGVDNDCDGNTPMSESDQDQDGYVICEIDAGGWLGSNNVIGGGDSSRHGSTHQSGCHRGLLQRL